MANEVVSSPSALAKEASAEAMRRVKKSRFTTFVMSSPDPSRDPSPMRTGAPEKKARAPLRSSPCASMATSKRRSRRSVKKSTATPRNAPQRPVRNIRFHSARSQTITSSRCGLWRMTSAVRSSTAHAMWAVG